MVGTYTDSNGSICKTYNNVVSYADGDLAYSYTSNSCPCVDCSTGNYIISDSNSSICSYGGEYNISLVDGSLIKNTKCLSYIEYLTINNYQEFSNEFNETIAVGDPVCKLGGTKVITVKSVGLFAGEHNLSVDRNHICNTAESIAINKGLTPVISSTVSTLAKGDSQCFYGGKSIEYIKTIDNIEIDRWTNKECNSYVTYSKNSDLGNIVEYNISLPVGNTSCPNGGNKTIFSQKIGSTKNGDDINESWYQLSCNSGFNKKPIAKTSISDEVSFIVAPEIPVKQINDNLVVIETPNLPSAVIKLESNDSVENIADSISKDIKNASNGKVSEVSTQKSNNCDSSIATEITILNQEKTDAKIVLNDILKIILGTSNITINSNTTTLADFFKARIVVTEVNGKIFASVSVVDNSLYSEFAGKMKTITSCNNFQQKEYNILNHSQYFESNGTKLNANVLFVIDDSGSMSDDQDAVKQAISDFGTEFEKANLGFRAGIITTGDGIKNNSLSSNNGYSSYGYYYSNDTANNVLINSGIINDLELLKEKSIVGICGSGIETGIYNSEYSLSVGGLARETFGIDDKSQMSIIIISDEPSQYTDRSGGIEFDPKNNIFVKNNWKVHVVVSTDDNGNIWFNPGQYDDLADATGGFVGNINNRDPKGHLDFKDIMSKIASGISGDTIGIKLDKDSVVVSTISVKLNGSIINMSETNGWKYEESSNSIIIVGRKLTSGDKLEITYSFVSKTINTPTN